MELAGMAGQHIQPRFSAVWEKRTNAVLSPRLSNQLGVDKACPCE
jgi:hypothetical protein